MTPDDDAKVHAALSQAASLLDGAVRDLEAAADRIMGLAERVQAGAGVNRSLQLQAEAIIEACAFQDLTGQKVKKVTRLIKFLRDKKMIAAEDLPQVADPAMEKKGLSQSDVDKLLSGAPIATVIGK